MAGDAHAMGFMYGVPDCATMQRFTYEVTRPWIARSTFVLKICIALVIEEIFHDDITDKIIPNNLIS